MQDVLLSRFAVLGDIHAEDKLLALGLGWLRASRVERIFSVGDIVDGQGDADRAVALLAAHRVEAVRGSGYALAVPRAQARRLRERLQLSRSRSSEAGSRTRLQLTPIFTIRHQPLRSTGLTR